MYKVKLKGIDIKHSDYEVPDGFLQKSINLQWRNESFKPIPERLLYNINIGNYSELIFHKVGDENRINVFGFRKNIDPTSMFLAFDLSGFLAGGLTEGSVLEWFGSIVDGNFIPQTTVQIPIVMTPGMSFTILNGLIYFMGDGTSEMERYYYRLQYDETTDTYEVKNMYAWKTLIPFFPVQETVELTLTPLTYNSYIRCGIILIRFTLVLNSGEEVLHSPIYGYIINGLTTSSAEIKKDDLIKNIHTIVNMNLEFADEALLAEEVTAINIYATTPYYVDKFPEDVPTGNSAHLAISNEELKAEFQRKAEENFYLVKTIEKPTDDKLLLTAGRFSDDIEVTGNYTRIELSTIAAGEVMPVDNFSYHRLYGKLTSYNGRLIVRRPVTVLSGGHIRALALEDASSDIAYRIETEDGTVNGIPVRIDKALKLTVISGLLTQTKCRGIMSYPDSRANYSGGNEAAGNVMRLYKCRGNRAHNIACAFNFAEVNSGIQLVTSGTDIVAKSDYCIEVIYPMYDIALGVNDNSWRSDKYSSENRLQFSQTGEFSVWPALNSYRIGEGKIMGVGNNSLNPGNAEVIAPLIVGTTEGVYTINLDPMGNNFIASITKTANMPYISEETLQIEGYLLFVSDKGLMAIQNGNIVNLTKDFFPDQGNGSFPAPESVFESYDMLTSDFTAGNFELDDIVRYMKDAILAYDGRRDNIWCSNPAYDFSLVFNVPTKLWSFSTLVFNKKLEYFGMVNTSDGELYTRYMVMDKTGTKLYILSGEDNTKEVDILMFTRPIKFDNHDYYKEITRMFVRTVLVRDTDEGYLSLGLWGKQDINIYKKSILIASKKDNRSEIFPNDVRQDIPVSVRRGKYKSINVLLAGKVLPDSYIASLDFEVGVVDEKRMR